MSVFLCCFPLRSCWNFCLQDVHAQMVSCACTHVPSCTPNILPRSMSASINGVFRVVRASQEFLSDWSPDVFVRVLALTAGSILGHNFDLADVGYEFNSRSPPAASVAPNHRKQTK